MVVNRTVLRLTAMLSIAAFVSVCQGQPDPSRYDPAPTQRLSKPQHGLVDFILHRINRADVDYGQRVDEGRALLFHETVNNAYFWSNLFSLGILACLFSTIVCQQRIRTRREWAVAEVLSQYESALARSKEQIVVALEKNRRLSESLVALHSTQRHQYLVQRAAEKGHLGNLQVPPPATEQSSTAVTIGGPKPAFQHLAGIAVSLKPVTQIAALKPEVELVTKVNSLEQQLERAHEVERTLRRQLDEAGKKLKTQQEKGRSQ